MPKKIRKAVIPAVGPRIALPFAFNPPAGGTAHGAALTGRADFSGLIYKEVWYEKN